MLYLAIVQTVFLFWIWLELKRISEKLGNQKNGSSEISSNASILEEIDKIMKK